MTRATIIGTGMHVPEKRLDNQYFEELYGMELDAFLTERRNIKTRHFLDENERTSDLIVPASQNALEQSGLKADQLDLIIVATDTPDYLSPSTAAVVQHRLGAEKAATFDVNSACAGFVTAMDIANKYISFGEHKNVLVVGAYGMSKYLDWDNYKLATLFADGAGAVVMTASEDESGVLASELWADGQYHDYMGLYAGGTATPLTHQAIEDKKHKLDFAKKIPLETNSEHWPRLTNILLDRIHKSKDDIDHFFLTQLNIETINSVMDLLELPQSKSHNIMDRFGYTGSACIPMALADAVSQKKLKKNDLVFFLGSGGGLSMASMAVRWGGDS